MKSFIENHEANAAHCTVLFENKRKCISRIYIFSKPSPATKKKH